MLFLLRKYIFLEGVPKALKVSVFITVLGITLAVAVLVASLSVANGFEAAYKKSILDFNAHVVILREGELRSYKGIIENVSTFEGVTSAVPFLYRESMAIANGSIKGIVIKGVDLAMLPRSSQIALKDLDQSAGEKVYIGKALADNLSLQVPSDINIMVGENRFQKIRVTGTFESGLYDYDSQFILMPIAHAGRLFETGDAASGIEIKLANPDDAKDVALLLEEEYQYPYQVTHWQDMNRPIFEAVKLEKAMFAVIVGVLVLLGMFNIIGTLVLRIIHKLRDIAVLSAIWMGRFSIRAVFTFHGLVLGTIGTFAGAGIGILAAHLISKFKLIEIEPEVYFLANLPARVEPGVVAAVVVASMAVSFVVAFLASAKAARMNISEALK